MEDLYNDIADSSQTAEGTDGTVQADEAPGHLDGGQDTKDQGSRPAAGAQAGAGSSSSAAAEGKPCFRCGKRGHLQQDCPEPEGSGDPNVRKCYVCGSADHLVRDCPDADPERLRGPRSRPPPRRNEECYNCGRRGHIARECRDPPRGRVAGPPPPQEQEIMSVIVKNMSDYVTPDRLREEFEKFGEVRDSYIPLHYHTRRPRGFAFVEFVDKAGMDEAIRKGDGMELEGKKITVSQARRGRRTPGEMWQRDRGGDYRQPAPRPRYERDSYRDDYRNDYYGGGGYDGYDGYSREGGFERGYVYDDRAPRRSRSPGRH